MVSIMPYVRRIASVYPDFVLGTGNDAFSQVLENTLKNRKAHGQSYWQALKVGTKDGFKAAEKHNNIMKVKYGNFWKSTLESIKTTPTVIKDGWKNAGAGKSGFAKFFSKFKGAMGGIGKRMPLIGTLLIAGFTLPNIFSAFKDKGIVGGVIETGKEAVKIGAGAGAAAVGAALLSPIPVVGPILGGLIGWTLGETLASKIVGKSHSEKKAEQETQTAQNIPLTNQQVPFNGYLNMNGNPMYQNPYMSMFNPNIMNDDFMETVSGINRINYLG